MYTVFNSLKYYQNKNFTALTLKPGIEGNLFGKNKFHGCNILNLDFRLCVELLM